MLWVRIWNQAEADNISYGCDSSRPEKLMPNFWFSSLPWNLISTNLMNSYIKLMVQGSEKHPKFLDQPKYTKIDYKNIFNDFAYSNYYNHPDKANLYLGGEVTPKK